MATGDNDKREEQAMPENATTPSHFNEGKLHYETGAVRYAHEFKRRLRICAIGAGRHPYFNTLPVLRFCPVDLVAVADLNAERAEAAARDFGAAKHYTDYKVMLEEERPEAVFIVTSYDKDGRNYGYQIALDALAAGAHVWMEKPTGHSEAEVRNLMSVAKKAGLTVMTGLKKMFTPGVERARDITRLPEFGKTSSIYMRYPQPIAPFDERGDLRAVYGLLDHIWHPMAIVVSIMGNLESFTYQWEPTAQGSMYLMRFTSGAIGTLHLAAGVSGSSPMEHLEVVGNGANVVLDNGVNLTYYRPSARVDYGGPTYLVPNETAPLSWSPEFSHGALHNNGNFLLGYYNEIFHFCQQVLAGKPVTGGTLEQVLEIIRMFDAIRTHPAGESIALAGTNGR
jgi:predicted dehydrogenase